MQTNRDRKFTVSKNHPIKDLLTRSLIAYWKQRFWSFDWFWWSGVLFLQTQMVPPKFLIPIPSLVVCKMTRLHHTWFEWARGNFVTEHCLRGVNDSYKQYRTSTEFAMNLPTFEKFHIDLEGRPLTKEHEIHTGGHAAVGGEMSNFYSSPADSCNHWALPILPTTNRLKFS